MGTRKGEAHALNPTGRRGQEEVMFELNLGKKGS